MSADVRGIMSNIEVRSVKGRILLGICLLVLIVTAIIVIFPFFFAFTAGLKTSTEIHRTGLHLWPDTPIWQNYLDAWNRFKMPEMFWNTFVVSAGGVIEQLIISSLAAFFLSRLKPIGSNIVMALVLITMAIPRIAYLVPLYITITDLPLLHINLVNSYWGLWLPYAVNSFMILVLKNAFDAIPREIYDAGQVDGASNFRMFLQFTLPLTAPLMLVLGLMSFIALWGDFLLPLLVLRDPGLQTVSVRLYNSDPQLPDEFASGWFVYRHAAPHHCRHFLAALHERWADVLMLRTSRKVGILFLAICWLTAGCTPGDTSTPAPNLTVAPATQAIQSVAADTATPAASTALPQPLPTETLLPATPVRIKNFADGAYLYEENGQAAIGSVPAADPRAQWAIEDYQGSKRIRNLASGNYLSIEHLQPFVEVIPIEPVWQSPRWTFATDAASGATVIRNVWHNWQVLFIQNGQVKYDRTETNASEALWVLETPDGAALPTTTPLSIAAVPTASQPIGTRGASVPWVRI